MLLTAVWLKVMTKSWQKSNDFSSIKTTKDSNKPKSNMPAKMNTASDTSKVSCLEEVELICNLLVNVLTEVLITVCSCSHKENKNASYCIIQQPKATIFLQQFSKTFTMRRLLPSYFKIIFSLLNLLRSFFYRKLNIFFKLFSIWVCRCWVMDIQTVNCCGLVFRVPLWQVQCFNDMFVITGHK